MQSCNDFLDVDPKHAASETQQWKTLEDTRSALMGVYGLTRAALADNNTHWICGDLRKGDFTVYKRSDLQAVSDNELNKPYDLLKKVSNWRRFYAVINAASVFMEKAPRTVELDRSYSEQNLKYDIAQVRALRAFAYFYMVRIWGDVPLVTYSYDNGTFPSMPRTDAQTVLSYAKAELLTAIKDLPYQYGTQTNLYYGSYGAQWQGKLFNKLSAYSVLAHICAWQGNYAEAETYSSFILDHASEINAKYTSIADLTSETGLFYSNASVKGSRILGFNFAHNDNEATQSGHLEQLTLAYPLVQKSYPEIYISKDSLFSIFTNFDDLRFGIIDTIKYSSYYVQNLNEETPVFSKIKIIQDGSAKDNDFGVFGSSIVFTRLEDITLLRAEALCALNRSTEAVSYLNMIRTNRGLREVSFKKDFGNNRESLIAEIFEERRRELMGEGWRWYDLVRRQKLMKDNEAFLRLISSGGIYWPVSEDIITANSQIEQNEFWK
ncbi:RagB/SusD family nutrient uptake outer membrane protein [Bacteroides thetaiotaomicron]|uniref:RagB/SusD family nutrient uptake outer membrane protein n=1 Tax=Bacteroides thetaiotaomicron TaxID=818 RepID=UPI00286DEF73|nr:RagB/SusD family nutrient uptake outer membrane protein [Bacteroides thetaiotaomicron]MCS2262266.1 RagB/SusD family nutrient uptake outer membrane protein [Bacteroides thetaiotaomicron]